MDDSTQTPSTFDRAALAKFQRVIERLNARGQWPPISQSENQEHYSAYICYHSEKRSQHVTFNQANRQVHFTTLTEPPRDRSKHWLSDDENNLRGWLRHLSVTDDDLVGLALDS